MTGVQSVQEVIDRERADEVLAARSEGYRAGYADAVSDDQPSSDDHWFHYALIGLLIGIGVTLIGVTLIAVALVAVVAG